MKALNRNAEAILEAARALKKVDSGISSTQKDLKTFLSLYTQVMSEFDDVWTNIRNNMEANGIDKVTVDDHGWFGFIDRTDYLDNGANPRYTKRVVDSKKVRAYAELHAGQLPKGIAIKRTKYFTKKVK